MIMAEYTGQVDGWVTHLWWWWRWILVGGQIDHVGKLAHARGIFGKAAVIFRIHFRDGRSEIA